MKDQKTDVIDITQENMQENTTLAATDRLEELEVVIERGAKSFYDVGHALAEIRRDGLYKLSKGGEFKTFEEYCRTRWDFSGRYARYLLTSAEIMDSLKSGTIVPVSETLVRPLTKLKEPNQWNEALQKAAEIAPKGKLTAKLVKKTVDEMLGKPSSARRRQPPHENINHEPKQENAEIHIDTTADKTLEETSTPHHQELPSEEIASAPDDQVTQEHVEENEDKTLPPPLHATPEPNREPETDTPATRLTAVECAERAIHELKMIDLNDPKLDEAFAKVRNHMDGIMRYKAEKKQVNKG